MALCYLIKYRDRFGEFVATKWGEKPNEALETLKKAHVSTGRAAVEYSEPVAMPVQPFSDLSRERLIQFWCIQHQLQNNPK